MAKAAEATALATEHFQLPSIASLRGGKLAPIEDEAVNAFAIETQDDKRAEVPSLPLIKIDHDNEVFLVNGEPAETIEGYVVNWFQTRAYWAKGYKSGTHTPPDCASLDTIKPTSESPAKQSEACYSCAMAAFGSAPQGDGQACKMTTYLCILNPVAFGSPPVGVLMVPPTSIRELLGSPRSPGYLARAKSFKTSTGRAAQFYEIVWSRFHLERGGDKFCVVIGEPVAVAPSADETKAIAFVRRDLLAQMDAVRGREVSQSA